MSSKRKFDDDENSDHLQAHKRSKSNKEQAIDKLNHEYGLLVEAVMTTMDGEDIENRIQFALDFLEDSFPIQFMQDLPPIIHLHQIYAIVTSRTQVDRHIENMRSEKLIYIFKFDTTMASSPSETMICFADKFKYNKDNLIFKTI